MSDEEEDRMSDEEEDGTSDEEEGAKNSTTSICAASHINSGIKRRTTTYTH